MATGPDSIPAYARSLGWSHGAIERYFRTLRESGKIPTGRKGGGMGAAHLTNEHHALVIDGFAGYQPHDASAACEALAPLVLVEQRTIRREPGTDDLVGSARNVRGLKGETLLGWQARAIDVVSNSEMAAAIVAEVGPTWTLSLCVNPPSAEVSWQEPDGTIYSDVFGPDQSSLPLGETVPPIARRLLVLPLTVMLTGGQLWADTKDRINPTSVTASGSADGLSGDKPDPVQMKAAEAGNHDGLRISGQPEKAAVYSQPRQHTLISEHLAIPNTRARADLLSIYGDRYDDHDRSHRAAPRA